MLNVCSGIKIIGGKCGRDTPGNMPNPEVKPASVDGTVRGTHGRANRCQFRLLTREEVHSLGFLFFVRSCRCLSFHAEYDIIRLS